MRSFVVWAKDIRVENGQLVALREARMQSRHVGQYRKRAVQYEKFIIPPAFHELIEDAIDDGERLVINYWPGRSTASEVLLY